MKESEATPAASGAKGPPPALLVRASDAATKAAEYLLNRQSPNGGFCFYRWQGIDEPSLHDTWHALATLRLLGVEVPWRERTAKFLYGFGAAGFDDFHHRTLALAALDSEAAPDACIVDRIERLDASAALKDAHVPVTARLERALRSVTLQRCFAAIAVPSAIVAGVRALRYDGGWGDKPNLGDTWLALAILAACGEREPDDATRRFVEGLQAASFGFTATADSMYANLETVHAGIRACAALGSPMRYATDAVGFVLACQGGDGGFARTPHALPNIALTHCGVLALIAAGALPLRDAAAMHMDGG
jgi:hypothetical protein